MPLAKINQCGQNKKNQEYLKLVETDFVSCEVLYLL